MKNWKVGLALALIVPIISTGVYDEPSAQGQKGKEAISIPISNIELAKKINAQTDIKYKRIIQTEAVKDIVIDTRIDDIKKEKERYRIKSLNQSKRINSLEKKLSDQIILNDMIASFISANNYADTACVIDTIYIKKIDTRNLIQRILNKNN